MTGLQKQVLEIPLVGGLSQHIAPEVAPVGALYDLTNVEIDRVGNVARRHGYDLMSRAAFNVGTSSVSSTMGIPKKIGGRRDELWVLTSESYYLGSGGGGGGSGDMLWTYSAELNAWKPHTKVPRPTMERWGGIANSGATPEHASVGFVTSGETSLIVLAYVVLSVTSGNAPGVHVVVYDATSRAVIVEDTIIDATTQPAIVQVVSVGGVAMVLWTTTSSSVVEFSAFNAGNADAGFSAAAILVPSTSGRYAATTDGTSLFVFYGGFASSDVFLERFSTAGLSAGALLVDNSPGFGPSIACCYGGGRIHMAWAGGGGPFLRYASVSTAGAGLTTPIQVSTFADSLSCSIAAVSADLATIFYNRDTSISGGPVTGSAAFRTYWRQVSFGSTSPVVGTDEHLMIGVLIQGEPFAFDNRVFLPVVGADLENQFRVPAGSSPAGYNGYGHVLLEIPADAGPGSGYITPFPVACWSRDASQANGTLTFIRYSGAIATNGAFGNDSDRYVATLRLLRNTDRFGGGARDPGGGSLIEPTLDTTGAYGVDIVRLAFDDKKRWQHAEFNNCALIASALPYCYDSLQAHECGYVFRPAILGILEDGVGSFATGDRPLYKATYEWEDVHGDRWFSDSSYPAEHEIVGSSKSLDICVRNPNLTAKPLGGNSFAGRIKVCLFRATSAASEDFQKIGEKYADTYGSQNLVFVDSGADDFSEAERCYTVGGELDNCLAPPCRSLVQHGSRLACISTDDGKLYLSKESRYQRGIEWSAYLSMSLPQRGMALVSDESALIVLCEKSIFALEGSGPDALGQPPDGFGRLSLLAHDKGCSEVNAAWRTPVGAIYRGYQGLWMVTNQLGFAFVGEPVVDFTDQVLRFVDGALDTRNGRLRLLCLMLNGDYRILNFWYDSNRWSIDTVEASEGTQYSSTVFQGDHYRALEDGVYKASYTNFHDGHATPIYLASVRTGWLRMGAMHDFKRVWRALGTVGKIRAEAVSPVLDLRFTVENEDGVCASRLFQAATFQPLTDWSVRMHLARQKGKAFRLQMAEVNTLESDEIDPDDLVPVRESPGYTYSSLGLEYGVKRGAAKLPAARTK